MKRLIFLFSVYFLTQQLALAQTISIEQINVVPNLNDIELVLKIKNTTRKTIVVADPLPDNVFIGNDFVHLQIITEDKTFNIKPLFCVLTEYLTKIKIDPYEEIYRSLYISKYHLLNELKINFNPKSSCVKFKVAIVQYDPKIVLPASQPLGLLESNVVGFKDNIFKNVDMDVYHWLGKENFYFIAELYRLHTNTDFYMLSSIDDYSHNINKVYDFISKFPKDSLSEWMQFLVGKYETLNKTTYQKGMKTLDNLSKITQDTILQNRIIKYKRDVAAFKKEIDELRE